jgi:hypothetical protein
MPKERFPHDRCHHPPGTGMRPYTATANEAHLSAEEAKAGQDPWVPGEDADAWRPRDLEAPAGKRPQAPHPGMTDPTTGPH